MESIAAHGYRISISGTAADELLSGYYDPMYDYQLAKKQQRVTLTGTADQLLDYLQQQAG